MRLQRCANTRTRKRRSHMSKKTIRNALSCVICFNCISKDLASNRDRMALANVNITVKHAQTDVRRRRHPSHTRITHHRRHLSVGELARTQLNTRRNFSRQSIRRTLKHNRWHSRYVRHK